MAKKQHSNGNHLAKKALSEGAAPSDVMFEMPRGGAIVRSFHLTSKQGEKEADAVARLSKAGWNIDSVKYKTEKFGHGMKFYRDVKTTKPKSGKSEA